MTSLRVEMLLVGGGLLALYVVTHRSSQRQRQLRAATSAAGAGPGASSIGGGQHYYKHSGDPSTPPTANPALVEQPNKVITQHTGSGTGRGGGKGGGAPHSQKKLVSNDDEDYLIKQGLLPPRQASSDRFHLLPVDSQKKLVSNDDEDYLIRHGMKAGSFDIAAISQNVQHQEQQHDTKPAATQHGHWGQQPLVTSNLGHARRRLGGKGGVPQFTMMLSGGND